MISIDFECRQGHRFEGCFKDHDAYQLQHDRHLIACPICESTEISRKYTGCSIQARSSELSKFEKQQPNLFEVIRTFNQFVRNNFEYVGKDFVDVARAIHYGIEEQRNIYGEPSREEVEELYEEGVSILPLIDIEDMEN
jgi:hypothetical protein